MQVYVKASSKRALNERLAGGETDLDAIEYQIDGAIYHTIGSLPHRTVIKIYEKRAGSTPIAKSYGTWDAFKRRVK